MKLDYILDYSELDRQNPLFSEINCSKPGCWKIEWLNALELIGIRPKLYSVKLKCNYCDGKMECSACERKIASSIPRHHKKSIHHEHFQQALLGNSDFALEKRIIKSNGQTLSIISNPISVFNCLTTTRILLPNLIDTIPFGFYRKDFPP